MLKLLGIIGVLLSVCIILSMTYGCAPKEDKYWGRVTKEIK